MTESDIKREICEFLERYPQRILFTVSPPKRTKYSSKFMRNGWPDIYGLLRNKECEIRDENFLWPFFIEVKKPGGTLALEQHKILEKAKSWGAIACVATSVMDVREGLGL